MNRQRCGFWMTRCKVASKSRRKVSPSSGCRCSYHCAAASNSSSASGWLTTGSIKPGADVAEGILHRLAGDFALGDFAGTPVNDFKPFGFVGQIGFGFEAGNQFACDEGALVPWQFQRLMGNFFSHDAHGQTVVESGREFNWLYAFASSGSASPSASGSRAPAFFSAGDSAVSFSAAANSAVKRPPLKSVLRKNSHVEG